MARLAEIIRRQFPVALIDEFQDTDPVQYRIFDAVYRVAQNAPDTALILIGDPKQAIYAFRGADIHTYLAARRACAERLLHAEEELPLDRGHGRRDQSLLCGREEARRKRRFPLPPRRRQSGALHRRRGQGAPG
jgi:hypothetical protein